jgi:putative membrane-bound dehydrogenase-like protein
MKRLILHLGWTAGLCMSLQAGQFKFPTQTFTVPDGFEVEQIAGPPLVERPISGSFDELGRLYVTDSSGSNDKVDKQEIEKPHRVRRLEDSDGDGRFDKTVLFAEHLMFPEGCLWFDGSLYVSAPPSIWKLTDANDDGVADSRSEWHQGKTLTGCANDLHGPYLGLDGWIYWCKGAFARQTYDIAGGKTFSTRASHVFRAPADHATLEPVLTAGMDNPVGVAFLPDGERFMCGTFLVHPEGGQRDGVVHAIYGGVYGKPHDVLDDHPKTGDLMPIMTHLGAAAPCSVIRYESSSFGQEYRDNLFVCCFNMHKISRLVLTLDGATFKTKDTDFLVSDNTDFHPTDVIEDADGSLIVIDTGGWYKLCCPTSQLSKPDVLGAIYRVRRVGAPKPEDPRGLRLKWASMGAGELVRLLDDPRPAVRRRALYQFSKLGAGAVATLADALKTSPSIQARQNSIWALTRIDAPQAREAVRGALRDHDESVAHAAVHSVSLWRDGSARESLVALLATSKPALQRAVAEALGRVGDASAVPALLAARAAAPAMDRVLEHSLIYALIELGDNPAARAALDQQLSRLASDKDALVGSEGASRVAALRAALVALDQVRNSDLKPELVAPLLASPNASLRQTAMWVAEHHADWGGALAGFFQTRLQATDLTDSDRQELRQQLGQFARTTPIQQIITEQLNAPNTPVAVREVLLGAMALAAPRQPPAGWADAVRQNLAGSDESLVGCAVATARVLSDVKTNAPDFSLGLRRIGQDAARSANLRLEALAALPGGLAAVEPDLFHFLCASLDPARPVAERGAACGVLTKAQLTGDQLLALADTLKQVGPLELTRLLGAFERSTNSEVGLKLIQCLKEAKGLASLRPDLLQALATKYPDPVPQRAQELLASLRVDTAQQKAHLDELLAALRNGDIRRGQAIFNSQKAACATCHAMGYLGGHVGPDLTSIGQVRTERDLLESIVYPSASFVRSYEPYVVKTKSDDEYSGVLRRDAPDEVVLATGPTTEVRIARTDIVDMRPGTVSIMPAGLDEQLTHQELADLVAFLKATKWGAN